MGFYGPQRQRDKSLDRREKAVTSNSSHHGDIDKSEFSGLSNSMRVPQHQLLQQQQAFVSVPTSESASQNTQPDEIQPATPPPVSPDTSPPSSTGRSAAVRVAVRIRPRCKHERKQNSEHETNAVWPEGLSTVHVFAGPGKPPKSMHFDSALGPDSSQEEVFEDGRMPSADCSRGRPGAQVENFGESQGLMPRMLGYLFQIYNEQVLDLLDPDSSKQYSLSHSNQGVHVQGLHEEVVLNAKEAIAVLRSGAANRKVATTSTNACSNRSHCIMRVIVECTEERDSQLSKVTVAQLTLVDLGSSEGASSKDSQATQPQPQPQPDGCKRSVEALMQVIYKVAQGHQHQAPYRESKLTYLLQNAFGGNAQTAVVANLSPTFSSMQDSLSTLKIAQNAALVKNMVQPNTCSTGEKQALHAEIQRLRSQVSSVKGQGKRDLELAQAQKQTQMVADTLRTTLERLEEEIARSNQLEDALKRANQRLSTRDRTIASMQQQLASAMRQQPVNMTPSTPSRATQGGAHNRTPSFNHTPSLQRASSVASSTHSTVTPDVHSQMHAHNPHDPALLKPSKSFQGASASVKAYSQIGGSHSVVQDATGNAQAHSQSSRGLVRNGSVRSTGSNNGQRSDSHSARSLEEATAAAAAQIAAVVAAAEKAMQQGADAEPRGSEARGGDTAELLARLPPHAVPNSPTETMAAHAQAVALASASVLSGGPRPSVSMPTDEAAAAAAKAADVAAHHVGTVQNWSSSGSAAKESSPPKPDRSQSDSEAQHKATSASPAKSESMPAKSLKTSATPVQQHMPQTAFPPHGPKMQMHQHPHMQQQHHALQFPHPTQQQAPAFPPPAVQPSQAPPPGRTVQPTVPYGYTIGELAPLPVVGHVSDSSFSDMTDSQALPKGFTRASKLIPRPGSGGRSPSPRSPSPLASVNEGDIDRLSMLPGRVAGGSAAVQNISLQSESALSLCSRDSASRTPRAGAAENGRNAFSNDKGKEKPASTTPSRSLSVEAPALDIVSKDAGSDMEGQNHGAGTADKAAHLVSGKDDTSAAAPSVPASSTSRPSEYLHKKRAEEQARDSSSPPDTATAPRQWTAGSQASAAAPAEHTRVQKSPVLPGQGASDNHRLATPRTSRRAEDQSSSTPRGRSEAEVNTPAEPDREQANGRSPPSPAKADADGTWRAQNHKQDTEVSQKPSGQVQSNGHVAGNPDIATEHHKQPNSGGQVAHSKTSSDHHTPQCTATEPKVADGVEVASRTQTLDQEELSEDLDTDSNVSSSSEELEQKPVAPHRLESLGDESLHMEISCMGGLSFAGNAVDDSGGLEGASDLSLSGRSTSPKQIDIQVKTKARTVEEHFNILGEVGNQAAERAMQRRQQLLAEQEQWLSGEQMFKGMSSDGMVLDEADMFSTNHDASGHERDLYTLQEECTADFSDISRVLSPRGRGGEPGTPRQMKRSMSRGMLAARSPRAIASPSVQSRGASDVSIEMVNDIDPATASSSVTSSPASHSTRNAFSYSAPRSPSAKHGAMHPLHVIQELGPSWFAAESTAKPDPQAHSVMHPGPVTTRASGAADDAHPEPRTPRSRPVKPVNGFHSGVKSVPSPPESPAALKKSSDARRIPPAGDTTAEPANHEDNNQMDTFEFWKDDDHDRPGGVAAARDNLSSGEPSHPKTADSTVGGATSQPHRNRLSDFSKPATQNVRNGGTRSPAEEASVGGSSHAEANRRTLRSAEEKECKMYFASDKRVHPVVHHHPAAAGNVSISPHGSPEKTTPREASQLPKSPGAKAHTAAAESQSAPTEARSPQSAAVPDNLESSSGKRLSLSSSLTAESDGLRPKGVQTNGTNEAAATQSPKPPLNKRGSWGLSVIRTPKSAGSSETPRRRAASNRIDDDLLEKKPRGSLQRSSSVSSGRGSLAGAESPRVHGGTSGSKSGDAPKPDIMSARARRAMTTEKLFMR